MPFYCVSCGGDMNSSLSNGEFKCLVRVILFGPLVSESPFYLIQPNVMK